MRTQGHVAVRHGLTLAPGNPLGLEERDEVNSFHDYAVPADGLGPQWTAAAFAPDGSIEAALHDLAAQVVPRGGRLVASHERGQAERRRRVADRGGRLGLGRRGERADRGEYTEVGERVHRDRSPVRSAAG